jgi:hypothetical protein
MPSCFSNVALKKKGYLKASNSATKEKLEFGKRSKSNYWLLKYNCNVKKQKAQHNVD